MASLGSVTEEQLQLPRGASRRQHPFPRLCLKLFRGPMEQRRLPRRGAQRVHLMPLSQLFLWSCRAHTGSHTFASELTILLSL